MPKSKSKLYAYPPKCSILLLNPPGSMPKPQPDRALLMQKRVTSVTPCVACQRKRVIEQQIPNWILGYWCEKSAQQNTAWLLRGERASARFLFCFDWPLSEFSLAI